MARPKQLVASTDRTLPSKYEGELEPNYFCRAWNGKRAKYCRARAGRKTSHSGIGRCSFHGGLKRGGDKRVTHGALSKVKPTTLEQLIAVERERADPLDLSGELATLRALVADLRSRTGEIPDTEAEIVLAREIGRMVERIEGIGSQNAVSRPELNRILQECWRSVDGRIDELIAGRIKADDVKALIREDWIRGVAL